MRFIPTRQVEVVAPPAATKASRVRGVDVARGLALLGMIAAHTLPLTAGDQPTLVGRLVNGPAAALFGVLAGLSVALLTGRRRVETDTARQHARRLAVRGLAIGTIGLALGQAELSSIDVILTYYGVLFVLAVPLVLLSTRVLAGLGAALVVVAPVTNHLLRAQLPPTELLDPSFTMLVTDPGGLLTTLLFTGAYPVWPWLAYLCVGIAVGRLRLDRTRTAAALALGGAALATVAAISSALLLQVAGGLGQVLTTTGLDPEEVASLFVEGPNGVTPATSWWWLAVSLPHSSTPFDLARTIGTSLAVLGLALLLDRLVARLADRTPGRVLGAIRAPLAAAGSMTLTFYVLHVVVTGLAPGTDPWVLFGVQAVGALAAGMAWQRFLGRGPLEAGVARLVDAVAPAPSKTSAPTTSRRVGAGLASAVAIGALLVAVTAGAGVALAFPSTGAPASTSAESEASEDESADAGTAEDTGTTGTAEPGATGDAAEDPAADAGGTDADSADAGESADTGTDSGDDG
ncbi:heparan-alpha-glucosaminide N-acetyltransferase domain-containing protein [Actinomycetospora straminea]|uniref:heparan-alpha-glucosaminide N-acetyltransferase domain-containing protein n=1 Tax=Actinomycetospora straminea TaxID=663607 RepID=UPI0023667D54|nr:heparan-alpha-glucosaminide N-acetyltransferase domain-containing protein [Actinomycetospora straminea]MDD7933402.1 heparan-alpha-glucosaminide N-acetyltransferase domain-containing protein [Actinomycetospora straminea]